MPEHLKPYRAELEGTEPPTAVSTNKDDEQKDDADHAADIGALQQELQTAQEFAKQVLIYQDNVPERMANKIKDLQDRIEAAQRSPKTGSNKFTQIQREIKKANDLLRAEERRAEKLREDKKELERKLQDLEKCAKVNAAQILERQQHIQAKTLELHQHCAGNDNEDEDEDDDDAMLEDTEDPLALQIAANEELKAAMQAQALEMRQQYEDHTKKMFDEFRKQIEAGKTAQTAMPDLLNVKPSAEAQDKVQQAQDKVDAQIKKAKDNKDKLVQNKKKDGKESKKHAAAASKAAAAAETIKNQVTKS